MNYFKQALKNIFESENGHGNLWLPIAFACGIILYFNAPFKIYLLPALVGFIACLSGFLFLRRKTNWALLFLFFAFFSGGLCRIIIQSDLIKAPFIHKSYSFVSVTGQVEKTELRTNGIRLTLNNLTLDKIPQTQKPVKVRITVRGQEIIPQRGDIVSLKAKLSPPMLSWLPDGYNFARTAYFEQIGAVGFAMGKLKIINPSIRSHPLENIRMCILKRILSILPSDSGNIAVALVTGEQGGISKTTRDNYTSAGIVHVLSVSGFHMTLIAGVIFASLRFLFGLFPAICLRYNTKKICALLALSLTFGYLLISGLAVPTIRSYIMIAFVLIAVLLDRQALSMRSVMWAGFLILLCQPEVLMSASFTLSFGAVIALIAGYEAFAQPTKRFFATKPVWIKWSLGLFGLFFIINLIAHLATSPIAIYHFHRYNNYAVLGNFLTSTTFSLLIMPLLLIATLLMPFGMDKPFILAVGYLLDKINVVTEWIAGLPYATVFLPSFPDWGYGLILFSGLCLCICRSKIRYLGLIGLIAGLLSIFTHTTPDIIIGQGGKLIAVRQENGFAFNSLRKEKVTRAVWLESQGIDPQIIPDLIKGDLVQVKGLTVDLTGQTQNADIIINSKGKCKARKLCLPRAKLWKEGTHSLYITNGNIQVKTSADDTHHYPWGQGKYSWTESVYP